MKRGELRKLVADVLEIAPETLVPETALTEIETFDSVAVLTLMVELDEKAGIRLDPRAAHELRFYGDIEKLAETQHIELMD